MRRAYRWIVTLMILSVILVGCGRASVVDRLKRRLEKAERYQSSFQMTHILPDGVEMTYLVDQWVAGDNYRVEVYDATGVLQQTLICDGQTLSVRHAPQGLDYSIINSQGNTLGQDLLAGRLLSSLTNTSTDLKLELVTMQGTRSWLIDLPPGLLRPDYDIGQRLWLDVSEYRPRQLELYTLAGHVVTRLIFTQFLWDPTIAAERFVVSAPTTGKPLQLVKIGQESLAELGPQLPFRLYQPRELPKGARLNLVTVVEEEGDPVVVQNYIWNDRAVSLVERPIHDLVDLTFGREVSLIGGRSARLTTTGQVCSLLWRLDDVELILSGCVSSEELISFAKSIY